MDIAWSSRSGQSIVDFSNDLHVPNASGDRAGSSGSVPEMRDDAGTEDHRGRGTRSSGETRSLSRKFWIALVLTIPVLFLAMGHAIPGLDIDSIVPKRIEKWIEFALTTPVVLWAGGFFFTRAWQSIVNRSLNMFTLIAVGVGAAYFYSAVAVIVPGIFPSSFRRHGEVDLYFEAAAVITTLILLGQLIEAKARSRTGPCDQRRCWVLLRKLRTEFAMARKRKSQWTKFRKMTCSACDPARKSQSTV